MAWADRGGRGFRQCPQQLLYPCRKVNRHTQKKRGKRHGREGAVYTQREIFHFKGLAVWALTVKDKGYLEAISASPLSSVWEIMSWDLSHICQMSAFHNAYCSLSAGFLFFFVCVCVCFNDFATFNTDVSSSGTVYFPGGPTLPARSKALKCAWLILFFPAWKLCRLSVAPTRIIVPLPI